MSGSITFNTISPTTRVPLFHIETDSSRAGVSQTIARTLMVGIATVSLASVPVFVPSLAWAQGAFGSASPLVAQIAAYLANDPQGELWACPVYAPGGSVRAAGSFAFSGTATAAGTIGVYIAGYRFPVSVAIGDTAATVAANLVAALGSSPNTPNVPVTNSVSTGTVTLTSNATGVHGNSIDLRLNYGGIAAGESLPAGLSCVVTAMASGTGIPDLSFLAGTIGDNNYDFIIAPFTDSTSLTTLAALMNDSSGRWSDTSQAFGHVWAAKSDTVANLITFGGTVNNQHLTVFGMYDSPTPYWTQAAAYCGAAAASLRAAPARPLQTLTVYGVLAPPLASRMTKANRNSLLNTGVAVAIAMRDGSVQIERAVTTYQTNKYAVPDQSYLDTETLYTIMAVIRSLRSAVTQQWPRAMLADDGTLVGPGSAVVTPSLIRAALIANYADMEKQALVQNTAAFAVGLVVQRNATDRSRVDVLYDPIIMSGLRIFAVLNQFRLAA